MVSLVIVAIVPCGANKTINVNQQIKPRTITNPKNKSVIFYSHFKKEEGLKKLPLFLIYDNINRYYHYLDFAFVPALPWPSWQLGSAHQSLGYGSI